MKVVINKTQRKLVAVVNVAMDCVFFRIPEDTRSFFINSMGHCSTINGTLEELLDQGPAERTPIYEGDTVTLQF